VLNDQGEFEAAEELFLDAVDLSVVAHCILGEALEGQKRYDDAGDAYRKAIAQVPWNGFPYSLLARVLLAEGKAEEARVVSAKAIEHFPKNTSAHETLALALLESGRREEALETTRAGIERVSDRPGLHLVRGQILASLGRVPEAASSLCEALVLHPHHVEAQDTLRGLIQNQAKTLAPDRRKQISETVREKLGRTDCAEVRTILSLLAEGS
jgi:tetratricopeptide (TPR) repeat protein